MLITILTIIQITSAVILCVAVLLQSRGSGLSGVFGGEGQVFRTKRGIEKTLFQLTIAVSIVFFASSLLKVVL